MLPYPPLRLILNYTTFLLASSTLIYTNTVTQAQLIPDDTLGAENSLVTTQQLRNLITGGAIRGENIFHSFSEFNINQGQQVYFANPSDIVNIFTRVTGDNSSHINGTLGVDGGANLFLLNPQGITFGGDAVLDISGSFFATTADSFVFGEDLEFSAANPEIPPLLTINIPLGIQFGHNPGTIKVQDAGHNFVLNFFLEVISGNSPPGLEINSGKTLALVGGDVIIEGANLSANQGRIELGSVAQSGFVDLKPTEDGFTLDYAAIKNFGNLNFSQASSVDVSGQNSGNLHFQGGNIRLLDGSIIFNNIQGEGNGGNTIFTASESVILSGLNTLETPSFLLNQVEASATGKAGDVIINTLFLSLQDGAGISASSIGAGNAGNLTIEAPEIELIADITSDESVSGLFSASAASGEGGNLVINTQSLSVQNGAQIAATSFAQGDAGNINIEAVSVELIGSTLSGQRRSALSTTALSSGDGGDITLDTQNLLLTNGSRIAANSLGEGDAGNITIEAVDLELRGNTLNGLVNALSARTRASGDGGNIMVETHTLSLQDGATIATESFGLGEAGNITIEAVDIELIGSAPNGLGSALSARTRALGEGGNIIVETQTLSIQDGAAIVAESFAQGNAGNIFLQADDFVEVTGQSMVGRFLPSRIATVSLTNATAGYLTIDTDDLSINDGAIVSVSNFSTGFAGNLQINADNLRLSQGSLTANTSGGGANINLYIHDVLQLSNESQITANATGISQGGNISIEAGFIIANPSQGYPGSDISANAELGNGGEININTQGLFGIEFQAINTPFNDITASSQFAAAGVVEISQPNFNPASSFTALSVDTVDVSKLIVRGCQGNPQYLSQFMVTGRGGLPHNHSELMMNETVLDGWVTLADNGEDGIINSASSQPKQASHEIVEATGWIINAQGKVILIADSSPPALAQSHSLPC